MILLVGDIHYDPARAIPRGDVVDGLASVNSAKTTLAGRTAGRDDDRELAACLRSFEAVARAVVLLGDVFDAFIEYEHVVPKGPMRTLGLLSSWVDRGIPVHYVLGNHDPWHRDWFSSELGFTLAREATTLKFEGERLHVAHGDAEEHGGRRLRDRVIRSRWAHRLWTGILPGDSGQGLARRVSRGIRSHELEDRTVLALRREATKILEGDEADVVAYGHSHVPEILPIGSGWYVNPGLWPMSRMIGVIESGVPRLVRWTDGGIVPHGDGE